MRFPAARLEPEAGFAANEVWALRIGWVQVPWRWNGKEWRCIKGVPTATTIFGSGANDVWLAGWGGALLHKGP